MSVDIGHPELLQYRYTPDEAPGLSRLELIHAAGGKLLAYYDQRSGVDGSILSIDDVAVERQQRRNGVGKELLQSTKLFGEEVLQADIIKATIVSRECLEAMKRVFGESSINVRVEGDYELPYTGEEDMFREPEGFVRTGASLLHVINHR